ncbi:Pentatricopeptide repeat [Macleaya cordata]|uniref:Pentatricopeptide repeat n=1 Tax=Macleaya cordata TaxID=56857 RepID=A0A200PNM7_MACCD|nr:Pentatricopeptide repeat [Macleaya cordata]
MCSIKHHRSANHRNLRHLFSTATATAITSPSPHRLSDPLLVDKAHTILKRYPIQQLNSLSSHFTSQTASHLLIKTQFDQTLTLKFLNWAHNHTFFDAEPKCVALHILTRFKLYKTAQSLAEDLVSKYSDPAVGSSSIFECLKSTYHLCNSSSAVFDLLVKSYSNLNMIDKALLTINLSKSSGFVPGVLSFNSVLDAIFRSKESVAKAEELYGEMIRSHVSPNVYSFNILIRGFCRDGKLEKALGFFNEMERTGCSPNVVTFNTLVDAYCKVGKIDEAFKLFELMAQRELRPNLITYNAVINGLCRLGRMKDTKRVVEEMESKGLVPDKVTYNTLVNGYCMEGNVHQALVLHSEMVQKGVTPNVITYTALINSMCRAGNLNRAMDFMDQMRVRGLHPNEITYTTFVDGFSKQGFLVEAYGVLKEMTECGFSPSVVTYNSIINGYCMLGRMDGALGVVRDMEVKGLTPDVVSYSTLLTGFCRNLDLDKAFQLKQEMINKGIVLDVITYSSLIQGLCEQRRLNEACELFQEMLSSGLPPDEFTYTTLINGFCIEGNVKKALHLHDEMIKKGFLPDVVSYSVLINGLSKQARSREAKQLLFRLLYEGSVPLDVTYDILMGHCSNSEFKSVVALIKSFCMKGLMKEADEVFQSMIKKSWKPDEAAYNVIIHGHCRGGNVSKALGLYKEMVDSGFVPNTVSVIALIRALFDEGMNEELGQVIQNVLRSCRLNDAEIAKVLVEINHKEGNMDVVFNVLTEMAKDGLLPNSGKPVVSG